MNPLPKTANSEKKKTLNKVKIIFNDIHTVQLRAFKPFSFELSCRAYISKYQPYVEHYTLGTERKLLQLNYLHTHTHTLDSGFEDMGAVAPIPIVDKIGL